jgi:hypothetical protein
MAWPKGKPRRVIVPGDTASESEHETQPAPRVKSVRLASMYGYITDDGVQRGWPAGHVVTDPDEIEELASRGAPFSEIMHHVD